MKKTTKNEAKTEKEKIFKEEEVETEIKENIEKTTSTTDKIEDVEQEEQKEVQQSKENEYLQLAQRTQAEFENYRKRTQKAEKEARQNGVIEAVKQFLPILDSFDMAQKQETNQEYINANSVIINQLNKALEDLNVKKIEAYGKPFDYNLHNAIMTESVEDKEDNIVLQVFQEGYTLNNVVIRHSIVKINKK